jgi:hypothetical protein
VLLKRRVRIAVSMLLYKYLDMYICKPMRVYAIFRSIFCFTFLYAFHAYILDSNHRDCMYIMTPEPILTAYLINPSQQSVCLCIPLSLLGNGSVKTLPRQSEHTQK